MGKSKDMQPVNKAWETEGGMGKADIQHRGGKKGQRTTEEIQKAMSVFWTREHGQVKKRSQSLWG